MRRSHSISPFSAARRMLAVTCLLVLAAALAWSCGGEGSAFAPTAPCDSSHLGQCDTPCDVDDDCPGGMHCRDGTCFAECSPGGEQCAEGVCDAYGRCSSGAGGEGAGFDPGTGGNGTGGVGQGGACGDLTLSLEPIIPTVVLLIDQSGSMTTDFNGQGSRWNVVYDALMDSTTGVVKSLEAYVRFGLALYTYSSGQCPELIEVKPPAMNAHMAIDAVYGPESPEANTPTGDSITAITPELAAFTEPGPKLIILATDGNPDRCEDPNGHDQTSMDEATDAAQAAYQQGIETVIIAVGDQVSEQHQQDMANAGSGRPVPSTHPCDPVQDPTNCAPTYEPTTKQALIDAFTAIIVGQRDCVFTLNGEVIDGKECEGTVLVNGVAIPCNDPDGWHLNPPSEIVFDGATCDTIKTDLNVTIEVSFPCETLVEPPD